jgi:hypothetical protein
LSGLSAITVVEKSRNFDTFSGRTCSDPLHEQASSNSSKGEVSKQILQVPELVGISPLEFAPGSAFDSLPVGAPVMRGTSSIAASTSSREPIPAELPTAGIGIVLEFRPQLFLLTNTAHCALQIAIYRPKQSKKYQKFQKLLTNRAETVAQKNR